MTLEALLDRMRVRPAARFGFDDKNDWTAFDLDSACTIDPQTFLSRGRATPFAGMDVFGECLLTIVGEENRMATPYDRKLVLETGEEFTAGALATIAKAWARWCSIPPWSAIRRSSPDPAYAFQIVVMTYPVIGNYGISDDDFESRAPLAAGLVVRDYNDQPSNFRYTRTLAEVLEDSHIPGICEVDTRRLARLIRDGGSRRALLTSAETPVEKALERLAETPVRRDAVECVSCKKRWYYRTSNHRFNVVAVDLGIKLSVVRCLSARGCNVTVVPWNTSAEAILAMKPDGVLFSGGPRRPARHSRDHRNGARPARQIAHLRHRRRASGRGAGLRRARVQVKERPPRGQPPGALSGNGRAGHHRPEPQLRRGRRFAERYRPAPYARGHTG